MGSASLQLFIQNTTDGMVLFLPHLAAGLSTLVNLEMPSQTCPEAGLLGEFLTLSSC